MMKRIWALSLLGGIFTLMLTLSAYASELVVTTIPQEDELRKTGVLILCSGATDALAHCLPALPDDGTSLLPEQKLVSEFKIEFALDGVNVDPDSLTCIVVQKEVCFVPRGAKESPRQFIQEAEGTNTFNVSSSFVCKYRKTPSNPASTEKPKPGVGVLDVYFVGTLDPIFIGDHILKVVATKGGVTGSEIQDICILDFPSCRGFGPAPNGACIVPPTLPTGVIGDPGFEFPVVLPETPPQVALRAADPIFPFASCKLISLWQRELQSPSEPETRVQACTTGNTLRGNQDP